MAKLGYSFKSESEEKISKAIARSLQVSPKWSFEVAREIRGLKLEKAKTLLEEIIEMKRPLPIKRYNKGVAHRRGLTKAFAGRYPVKACSFALKALNSAEANAEYKGLDVDRLYIKHAQAKRGQVMRRFRPRAFGRASAHNTPTTHLEIVLEER